MRWLNISKNEKAETKDFFFWGLAATGMLVLFSIGISVARFLFFDDAQVLWEREAAVIILSIGLLYIAQRILGSWIIFYWFVIISALVGFGMPLLSLGEIARFYLYDKPIELDQHIFLWTLGAVFLLIWKLLIPQYKKFYARHYK
ncbi:MAG TPA: hypothetical protein VGA53_03520 [Candidatus Paceibacterota bacterium]